MAVKTYNPKKVAVVVGGPTGAVMSGFAEGEFVTVTMDEDKWELKVGTDGEGTRSKQNNNSATVKIMLMQSSDSNLVLQGFLNSDKLSDAGIFPLMIKDSSGRSLYMAEQAWIQKQPEAKFSKGVETREWTIRTDNMIPLEGGN